MYKELTNYYRRNGISAIGFNCPNFNSCSRENTKSFTTAKEAFVSTGYVAHTLPRLVFISLDSGSAQTDPSLKTLESVRIWEEERENVLMLPKNKHWYRTHELAHTILKNFDPNLKIEDTRHYFAHINSAKCCQNNIGRGQANQILFDNCRQFIPGELEILDPDIIITQGKWGKLALNGAFPNLLWPGNIPEELREVKFIQINRHPVLFIETFHPRHTSFHTVNRPHYPLYIQVIKEFMKANSIFESVLVNEPRIISNPIKMNSRIIERQPHKEYKKEKMMTTRSDQKVTGYLELNKYPEYPAAKEPSKLDCEGFTYMSMVQLCNLSEKFGKSRSFACNAFGGDKGAIPVQSDRQVWVWLMGGKQVKKFVLIRALERFFDEEGLPWK
ncbi:MAG: uracil-DNA glycosylase family protein [Anaerolineaceae bacterium]